MENKGGANELITTQQLLNKITRRGNTNESRIVNFHLTKQESIVTKFTFYTLQALVS